MHVRAIAILLLSLTTCCEDHTGLRGEPAKDLCPAALCLEDDDCGGDMVCDGWYEGGQRCRVPCEQDDDCASYPTQGTTRCMAGTCHCCESPPCE